MSADTFTPTSMEDRGESLYFSDGSNAITVPRHSAKATLYLQRLNKVTSAEFDKQKEGVQSGVASEVTTLTKEFQINAEELLTLQTFPKTVIEAPGSGKKIQLISVSLFLDYNATQYVNGSLASLAFSYKDTAGAQIGLIDLNDLITASEDGNLEYTAPGLVSAGDDASLWNNQPLVMYLTQALTTGDSPLRIKIVYRIDETGL